MIDRLLRPDLALVAAAFFFGTTFVVVQDAVAVVEPIPFLAVRFLIAAAVLLPLAWRRPSSPKEISHGIAAGGLLLVGYLTQTVGLQYTEPATSAFITYLLVVFVPAVAFLALGERPHPLTLAGAAVAVVGLVLLTGGSAAGFGRGEVLTLCCAVAFAAHVVLLGRVASLHDPVRLTCIQLAVVAAACLPAGGAVGGFGFPVSAWVAAAGTGVFATAAAFGLMVWAQRVVRPARAAIILLLEPVFAAALAATTGSPPTGRQLAGGALIVGSVVLADALPMRLTEGSSSGQASR